MQTDLTGAGPEGSKVLRTIWVRGQTISDLDCIDAIEDQLIELGVAVASVRSLPDPPDATMDAPDDVLPTPKGKEPIRRFLAAHPPSLVLAIGEPPDPQLLAQTRKINCDVILANISTDVIQQTPKGLLFRRRRRLFSACAGLLAADTDTADRLRTLINDDTKVVTTGALQNPPTVLPYDRDQHGQIVDGIGTRQSWLAAALPASELDAAIAAHKRASRTAHRLLMLVAPRNMAEAAAFARELRDAGFVVGQRSKDRVPTELMQVFLLDQPGELGLWYRVAPICYLGGTLSGGACRDPYEAASLGSALLTGPNGGQYLARMTTLENAGASLRVADGQGLGDLVERLLPADLAAAMAHAAWDVTTKGAVVTDQVAAMIMAALNKQGDA